MICPNWQFTNIRQNDRYRAKQNYLKMHLNSWEFRAIETGTGGDRNLNDFVAIDRYVLIDRSLGVRA